MGTGYSSLFSSFTANIFSHKLADNNPDSQNNLCKPTQCQHNLNLHKRAVMGCVSGNCSITGKQCLSASLGLQQAKLELQRLRTPRKRCSMLVNKIIEDLNDNGSPQSEPIRSVSPANEAWAALPRYRAQSRALTCLKKKKSQLWWALRDKTRQTGKEKLPVWRKRYCQENN